MVLQQRYRASQRKGCRVAGKHRSTKRHPAKIASNQEGKLRRRLREIAAEHVRWGRRMAHRLLRREGWLVNHKREQRLWREEGLQPPTPSKKKRTRPDDDSVRRHQAEHPHQAWGMNFRFDATAVGRRLKFLTVIDEHSRLCLAIWVGRRCKVKDIVAVLEELTSIYPRPPFIRSDNGPEFIAHTLRSWVKSSSTKRRTSSPDPRGRKGYRNRSTAGSRMNSLRPICSRPWPRPKPWLIAGVGSTTPSGRIRPARGVRPWRQLKKLCITTHSHCT